MAQIENRVETHFLSFYRSLPLLNFVRKRHPISLFPPPSSVNAEIQQQKKQMFSIIWIIQCRNLTFAILLPRYNKRRSKVSNRFSLLDFFHILSEVFGVEFFVRPLDGSGCKNRERKWTRERSSRLFLIGPDRLDYLTMRLKSSLPWSLCRKMQMSDWASTNSFYCVSWPSQGPYCRRHIGFGTAGWIFYGPPVNSVLKIRWQ